MSVASITNPSLRSSPTPRSNSRRQNPAPLIVNSNLPNPKFLAFSEQKILRSLTARASPATESQPSKSEGSEGDEEEEKYEEYEVEIEKPYGLKFAKGRDGSMYIDAIAPGSSAAKTGKFTVGDKVIATRQYRCHTHGRTSLIALRSPKCL